MDYIVKCKGIANHFFFERNEGLCMRPKNGNKKIFFADSGKVFSVFCDSRETLHAVCVSHENNLIYLRFEGDEVKNYTILHIKKDMEISDILLFETPVGLNILYTAVYLGETLLIHCILGDNAMPDTVAQLSSSDFFVFKNNVYYSDSNNILGYRSIADGKAGPFNRIDSDAYAPYLFEYLGKDMITYKKGDSICFQNRPVHKDLYATNPILFEHKNKLFLQWQSGDFVRHISASGDGWEWGGVTQFVNSGKKPQLCRVVSNAKISFRYGNRSKNDLNIYVNLFDSEEKRNFSHTEKIEKFNMILDFQKNEIEALKEEIRRLGEYISEIKKNDISEGNDENQEKI